MIEAEWSQCTKPFALLEAVQGQLSDRKLRLFSCACLRRVWHSFEDAFRQAIEETEQTAENTVALPEEAVPWWLRLYNEPAFAPLVFGEMDVYDGVKSILVLAAHTYAKASVASWLTAHADSDPVWRSHIAKIRFASAVEEEESAQASLLRDVAGMPSRRIRLEPALLRWKDGIVVKLAQSAYMDRFLPDGTLDPSRLAILADALEEAGCTDTDILGHCRSRTDHVRGCWVVDLVLGKS